MKFTEWVLDLFKDERGSTSIKPVVAAVCTLFLCVSLIINSISKHESQISNHLVDAIVIVTVVGLGADSVDKFSKKSE
jgi:hypothetical protein